jgi:hypothetical protein
MAWNGEIFWAIRISNSTETEFTPYQLIYGQDNVLPLEINLTSLRAAKQPARAKMII